MNEVGGEKMNEIFEGISWGVIAPIIVIQIILLIIALFSLFREEKTNGPKWIWVPIILFISLLGPVLYFVIGRRNN